MKNEMILGYALAAVLSLGACSSKVSGLNGIDGRVTKAGDISGPSLEGQWKSGCLASSMSYGSYRSLSIKFTGANVEHTEQAFSNSACTDKIEGGETLKGTFSYTKNVGDGVYQIEYRIPVDSNVSALRDLRLSVNGDTLNVSQWLTGFGDEDKDVAPSIPLQRVGAASTTPTTTTSTPKPSSGTLRSGTYLSSSTAYCNADISTAASNGRTVAVYMQLKDPCEAVNLRFDCVGNECSDSEGALNSVTLKDADHFLYNIPRKGLSIGYSRQ